MKCVKTGLKFSVIGFDLETFHGDMFFCETLNVFIVRGIANGTSSMVPDITFKQHADIHMVEHVNEKFLANYERMNRTTVPTNFKVFIDDSRFF